MQLNKPIRLFVPTSIWNVIDGNVKRNKEYYVYIIHYILYRPVTDKRFEDFVPLNKKKLECLFGCKLNIYIDFLEKNELIECDKKFIPGEKSYYYRINPKHSFDCNTYELKQETKLFKNIIGQIKTAKTNYCKLEPFLNAMRKEFMNLQFDYTAALSWVMSESDAEKKISYAIAISQLQDNRFRYFKRNLTNKRLDTNLTNLKKELRSFIKGDYVSIDLKNSQPFLLSFLLKKIAEILNYFILKKLEINQHNIEAILNSTHLPLCFLNDLSILTDVFGIQAFKSLLLIRKKHNFHFFTNLSKYNRWVSDGVFYDEFVKEYGNQLTRSEVKKILFEVLFSNNSIIYNYRKFIPFEKEKKVFSTVFPVVYEMIEQLKEKDNRQLAIYLQKLESQIFIDKVAKELVENGIIPFTIHDSIIVPSHQRESALNVIQSVFKKNIGIIPAFHIEQLGTKFKYAKTPVN